MHDIIDVAQTVGNFAEQLANAGVKTVIRYYNHRNSAQLPTKALTRDELDQLHGAGLSVAVVFQQRGGAGGNLADFSAANGERDARRALQLAQAMGQPDGTAIYFGVDHDFFRSSELTQIQAYFSAVRNTINGKFRVGCYGSGKVGNTLRNAGTAELVWLAAARGWSGTRDALASGQWVLDQRFLEMRSEIGGFIYDGNVFNPAAANFGQFSHAGPEDSRLGTGSAALLRVIARPNLNLRPTPDTRGEPIGSLPTNAMVRGLGRSGDWIKVDLDGDGRADGFANAAFLEEVSGGVPLDLPTSRRPIDVARAELALDVREVPGERSNPRIAMYHATTAGGAAPDETAWCSSFVNYCVEQSGLRGTRSKWARSWHEEGWGRDVTPSPQEGDIVVWRRQGHGDDGGHVGFYIDGDASTIQVLGGNQGNRISIARYPRNGEMRYLYTLLSIRRG